MRSRTTLSLYASAVALALFSTCAASAQSNPARFLTVYNIGTVPPGSIFDITSADIFGEVVTGTTVGDGDFRSGNGGALSPTDLDGDILESDSQLNLFDGGEILQSFEAGAETGGSSDIEVNINGGTVGMTFEAYSGSTVNISGGTLGRAFQARAGSSVNITGGEFRLNGSAVNNLSSGFGGSGEVGQPGEIFTGILADGRVFVFAEEANDNFAVGTTTLISTAVPPSANPGILSNGVFSQGVRRGETLTVNGTGALSSDFAVVGGTLNIDDGMVGDALEVAFGEVNIAGGIVGESLNAFFGSTVNIRGGAVGSRFAAEGGSTVNIRGGAVGSRFAAEGGSTVNIRGGAVGLGFDALSGTTVNISGGMVGDFFDAGSGSTVNIRGGMVGFRIRRVFQRHGEHQRRHGW